MTTPLQALGNWILVWIFGGLLGFCLGVSFGALWTYFFGKFVWL